MKLKGFITFSLIIGSLPSNDVFNMPFLVFPKKGVPTCVIGENDCIEHYLYAQSYVLHCLNVERYWLAMGGSQLLPIATNMLLLERDSELEAKAQKHAETCLQKYGPTRCPPPGENEVDGEVYISVEKYSSHTDIIAMKRLCGTIMKFARNSNLPKEDVLQFVNSYTPMPTIENLNNFAKLIHADVWKVGCGFADFFTLPGAFEEVFVCFFGPPKLIIGEALYIAGCMPCSNCPPGTSCDEGWLRNNLCKVHSNNLPIHRKHKLSEEEICYKIKPITSKPSPTKPSLSTPSSDTGQIVWTGTLENSTQECRGEHSCSPGWEYKNDYIFMDVKGKCTSTVAFQENIYIENSSCFQFYYYKNSKGQSTTSDVIAFAFEVNSKGKGLLKEAKHETQANYIYLDIPWNRVHIHVGFGTRSQSVNNEYQIILSKFAILSGKCQRKSFNNA